MEQPTTQAQAAPAPAPSPQSQPQQQAQPAPQTAPQQPLGQQPQQAPAQAAPASVSEQQIQQQMAQGWISETPDLWKNPQTGKMAWKDNGTGVWRDPETGEKIEPPPAQNQNPTGTNQNQSQPHQPQQQQQAQAPAHPTGFDAAFYGQDGQLDLTRISQVGDTLSQANYLSEVGNQQQAEPPKPVNRQELWKTEIVDYEAGLRKEKLGAIERAWSRLEQVFKPGSPEYNAAYQIHNAEYLNTLNEIQQHMDTKRLEFQDKLDAMRGEGADMETALAKGEWEFKRNLEIAAKDIGGVVQGEQLLYGYNNGQKFVPSPHGVPLFNLLVDVAENVAKNAGMFSKADPGKKYRMVQNIIGATPDRLKVAIRYAFNDFRAKNIRHTANAIREAATSQAQALAQSQTAAPGTGKAAAVQPTSRIQQYYHGSRVDSV